MNRTTITTTSPITREELLMPLPTRRRTALATAAVAMAAASSLLLPALPAHADTDAGLKPACADGTCTIIFTAAGEARQTFPVPADVTTLTVSAVAASGGGRDGAPGGWGGRSVADVPVAPGMVLSVLVGTAGESIASSAGSGRRGGIGGGGDGGLSAAGFSRGGGGGGGSFLYGPSGNTLLAAGGGGGQAFQGFGGYGGTASADGQTGENQGGAGATSTTPGTAYPEFNGTAGRPTSASSGVGVGGTGGETDKGASGGGGGGGYNGGGGGAGLYIGGGGGGGAGYAAQGVVLDPTASQTGANSGDGKVTISWTDDIAPTIESHPDVTAAATSAAGPVVSFTPAAATDSSGDVQVSCDPASGSTFALGVTRVTCTATDGAGNRASTSFTVTVADTDAPTIAAHDNVTATAAAGASTAKVTYTEPTATDQVDGVVPVSCTPASGSAFPIGTTTVTCTAADRAKNSASRTFTVKVNAATPAPTKAAVKAVVTGPATAPAGSKVTYTMKVTNNGPAAATGLTSVLGTTGLTGVTASTGGSTGSATIAGQKVSGTKWVTPSLPSGQSITFTVTGIVAGTKGQSVTALGGATSTVSDPNAVNNLAAMSTKIS